MKVTLTVLPLVAFATSTFAAASPEPTSNDLSLGYCGYPGAPCSSAKRAANAVAEALHKGGARLGGKLGHCNFEGNKCHLARRAIADIADAAEASYQALETRDASPSPWHRGMIYGNCGWPGITCAKAKRDAAPAPWHRGMIYGNCGWPGITCAKKTRRAIDDINSHDPTYFKDECFAEGNECDTVLKAAAAFKDAQKREAQFNAESANISKRSPEPWHRGMIYGNCGWPGITCARDVREYASAKVAGDSAATKAEQACNSPDGDCTIVQRSLDDLEAAINKAVEDVSKL